MLAVIAVSATAVIAYAGEPNRTTEAAVERPIVATDAVCFGLVVTDVAVAAPVRRLDPPSLFPAGVGWDVERGAIVETARGTFLVGWEPSGERGDVELNFAVLKPSGRPFAAVPSQGGLRRFSASARLAVEDPLDAEVRVVAGTNEAYVTVHEPSHGILHVLRLVPDRITGTGAVDPDTDVISIATSGVEAAVGAARLLWLTEPARATHDGHALTAIAFGGPDGPVAATATERLASPHLADVSHATVGQMVDGALARWEFRDDGPAIVRTDVHALPDQMTGGIVAASMRGSSVPAVAITTGSGEIAVLALAADGRPTATRVFGVPDGVDDLRGVLAGPAVTGLVGTVDGQLGYWLAADGEELTPVTAPGDACSIRNETVARRILEPVAGGDLVFLHYPDRQADCVVNLPKGPACISVDRSTGGIPRPNLAAISELELPELELGDADPLTDEIDAAPDDEPEEVELDLVGESVTSDPCDIVDPARILTDGRPELTSIQAEGEGLALAWWWSTTDDGCVPGGYEFARVAGGTCSANWPSSPSDRLTINVDIERTGFSTAWPADPGEEFAVWVRGLVDGQQDAIGNVDCRGVRVPVAAPPDPSGFSAHPSGDNWSLSWSFSCVIAASCGDERFEVTVEFCSGSARQSLTTAETSLTIPIDDALVGRIVKFSVVTLRDADGHTLRSGAASVGCAESVRPPRDGSPGDVTLSAPAGGNLRLDAGGDARSELIKLLGTSQLEGLTASVSRGGASASGSPGFSGEALSVDLGTPECFGSAWSVSFSVGDRSIAAGSHAANCTTAITGQSLAVAGSGTTLSYVLTVDGLSDDVAAGAEIGTMSVKCGSQESSGSPSVSGDDASLTLDAAGCLVISGLSAEVTVSYPGDTPGAKLQASTDADGSAIQAIFAANQEAVAHDHGLSQVVEAYDADADIRSEFPRNVNAFLVDITLEPGCHAEESADHTTDVVITVGLANESQDYIKTVTCLAVVPDEDAGDEGDEGDEVDEEGNGEGQEEGGIDGEADGPEHGDNDDNDDNGDNGDNGEDGELDEGADEDAHDESGESGDEEPDSEEPDGEEPDSQE